MFKKLVRDFLTDIDKLEIKNMSKEDLMELNNNRAIAYILIDERDKAEAILSNDQD